MKLTYRQIDPFLQKPDPKARVILVYGPDAGLVKERAAIIARTVVEDLHDPFNVADLSGDLLAEDPARLSDEAQAQSMMGGDRLVRITDAADKLAPLLKGYLEDPSDTNLVLVEAGDLSPRSALRKICEAAKNAAALPCYVEDEQGISRFVRDLLSQSGYRIDKDALHLFAGAVSGDRQQVRGETEKLMLYMGEDQHIDMHHVAECTGKGGEQALDAFVYAVFDNRPGPALDAYGKLQADGIADIAVLRAMQNHLRRLYQVRLQMDSGQTIDQAVKSLQPPLFFKLETAFKSQVDRLGETSLRARLNSLIDLEAQTKKTGFPVSTLCAQAILAQSARRT